MRSIKTALLVGALAIASSSAFAQTIVPNIGVDFGSPSYRAYQRDTRLNDDFYRLPVGSPAWAARLDRYRAEQTRAEAMGAGIVTGGGVSMR